MNLAVIPKGELNRMFSYPIFKHNDLIRTLSSSTSALEYCLLHFILQRIRPSDTELPYIKFSIKDYCYMCGLNPTSGKNYENIRNALIELQSNPIVFTGTDEKGKSKTLSISWITAVQTSKGDGSVVVELHQSLAPYLLNLKNNFTIAEFPAIARLDRVFSGRFYDLLKSYSFENNGIKEMEIDNLKKMLRINGYNTWSDLKKRALDPSVQQINDYTELSVKYKPLRRGRSIKSIEFTIKKKEELLAEITQRDNLVYFEQRREKYAKKYFNDKSKEAFPY